LLKDVPVGGGGSPSAGPHRGRGAGGGGAWVFGGFNERGDQPRRQLRVPCAAGGCKVEPQAVLDEASQSPAWK